MHRRGWGALIALVALLLTGCWDRVEVNDLAVATLVGIDVAGDGVRLTVNVMAPRPSGGGGSGVGSARGLGYAVYQAEGATILDAVQRMQLAVPRRLFWGHTRVLVLGRPLAVRGIGPVIDFWSRQREPRQLVYLLVADGEAADLLEVPPKLEQLLVESVRETLNLRGPLRTRLRDVVITLRDGGNPVLPVARPVAGAGDQPEVLIADAALFRGDRLIGVLPDREAMVLEWLLGSLQRSIVPLELEGGRLAFQLEQIRPEIVPVLNQGRLQIRIGLKAEAKLLESATTLPLDRAETLRSLQQRLGAEVAAMVTRVVRVAQREYRTDILRAGDAVHRFLPVYWERQGKARWDERWPALPVVVSVDVTVRSTGGTSKSLIAPE